MVDSATRSRAARLQTHIALLRGVNVGGRNKLAMRDLAAIFEACGCEDVRTYIQSGNVVFSAPRALAKQVSRCVEEAIAQRFNITSPVITRSAKELADAIASVPFRGGDADESKLHVAFLARKPHRAAVESLDPNRSPGDVFAVMGREIYLHLPEGVARTKLTNDYFDKALGTTSTVRTWRTVLKLAEMVESNSARRS